MAESQQVRVGTRGSSMALAQTQLVVGRLKVLHPELDIQTQIITTRGDTNLAPIPLDTVGKAWFTEEIEQALQDGAIDLAIHSLKDVPPEIGAGLQVLAVLKRDDPRDALVARDGKTLAELPNGAVVGTDSLRRKALLLACRPDLRVQSVRGNATTRLEKLKNGAYDALVMAVAGLERIGRADVITDYFDAETFVPAIGQGALAAEWRSEREDIGAFVAALGDPKTLAAVAAEQAFAAVVGGGCKLPVGCYVRFENETAQVYGMAGSMDGTKVVIKTASGPADQAIGLARTLAEELAAEPFVAQYVNA